MVSQSDNMEQPRKIALLPIIHLSWGRDLFDRVCSLIRETTDWEIVLSWPLLQSDLRDDVFRSTSLDAVVGNLSSPQAQEEIHRRNLIALSVTGICVVDGFYYVIPDNVALGKLAADYLLSLKFSHFHFIVDPSSANSDQRFNAFRSQLRKAGYDCAQTYVCLKEINSHGIAKTGLFRYIESTNVQTAIMCSNDNITSFVVNSCKILNKRIPEDVALVSTEDNRLVKALIGKNATAILYDVPKQAERVVGTLHQLFRGESVPHVQTIPPLGLMHGETTEQQVLDDPLAAKVLKYIQSNIHEKGLELQAIARMHGMSLRTMERRLKNQLEMTPQQLIRKLRIDKSKSLLTSTDQSIYEIADHCGFDYPQNFHRAFKKLTGQSPNAYRATMKR